MASTGERRAREAHPRHAAATRERIVSEALLAFSGRGYDGVSLDDVAAAAQVRKATIFYYFPSKAALYEAVAARVAERFSPLAARMLSERPSLSALESLVGELHDLFAGSPEHGLLFFREAIDRKADGANLAVAPFLDLAERWVRRGQRAGVFAPHLAARQAVDAVIGAVTLFFLNPRVFLRRDEPLGPRAVLAHRKGAVAFVRRALLRLRGATSAAPAPGRKK